MACVTHASRGKQFACGDVMCCCGADEEIQTPVLRTSRIDFVSYDLSDCEGLSWRSFVPSLFLLLTRCYFSVEGAMRKLLCVNYVYINVYNKRQFMSKGLGPGWLSW